MGIELVDCWTFSAEGMTGVISGGHEHGIELTGGADKKSATRRMCLNLEHYYARACRGGRFVPRYKAQVSAERVAPDTVRLRIAPHGDWHVESVITYRVRPGCIIEATFEFAFGSDYGGFEALISNYFHEPDEPYLRLGGSWVKPSLGEREHRTFFRGPDDVRNFRDGRHEEFQAEVKNDYLISAHDGYYDEPVMISPIRDTGWSIVHVVERETCASLWLAGTWFGAIASSAGHGWSTPNLAAWTMPWMSLRDFARGIPCRRNGAGECRIQDLTCYRRFYER
jgi:hypothetical protein